MEAPEEKINWKLEMNKKNTMQMIKKRVKNLPLVKESVYNTLSVLNDPKSNFSEIAERISPGVAAEFLNMANTASSSREIRSLNHAIKLIGYNKMKQILSTSILMDNFAKQSDFNYFSFDKFHRQAQFCAMVSVILGQITEYENTEDLFTAAILLNIGKLIIAIHFSEEHKKIIEIKKTKGISTSNAEKEILGTNHPEIGAFTLEQLKIPKDICDAVRYHDFGGPVPPDTNYQLIMISRESSRIVDKFKLPRKINFSETKKHLQEFIEESRKEYRKNVRVQIRATGYKEFFPELLSAASTMVSEGMEEVFKKRARLSIIAKNQED